MDRTLRISHQGTGSSAVLIPGQSKLRCPNRLHQLAGTAQQRPAGVQFFVLTRMQFSPLQLPDLIIQRIHPAGALRLIHL